MMKRIYSSMIIFIALNLTGCATHVTETNTEASKSIPLEYLVGGKFDIRPSWEKASVYLPGKFLPTNVAAIEASGERDAVVFLHGCGGIKNDEIGWSKFFTNLGYVVVLPDSFAIKGRPLNCSSTSTTPTTGAIGIHDLMNLRIREFRLTSEKLRSMKNIRKTFVVGFSEGGAVANMLHNPNLFDGLISISSYCISPAATPKQIPVLTIDFESDPWFRMKNMCKNKYQNHEKYTQVTLTGNGHSAFPNKIAEEAIKKFLSER
jgi:dienelactone hydrolase